MSINGNKLEAVIQNERITELEQRIDALWKILSGQNERIKQLETCATINAETIGHVAELRRTVAEQDERIEKLEAALLDVARCLFDGELERLTALLSRCPE